MRTTAMDPPWLERGGGKICRGAQRHYPLMKTPDILRTIQAADLWYEIDDDPDGHLYLWVTNNFLPDGEWLMAQLGFRYVTNIAWVKVKEGWAQELLDQQRPDLNDILRIGLGQYFRGSHELCLFGVKGACHKPKKALPSAFFAPRGQHSAKPNKIYEIIESTSPGPYAEFFARGVVRPGWVAFGNEVEGG